MNYSACCRVHALVREANDIRKEAGFWDGVGSFARGGVNALKGFGSAAGNALTAIPQSMMSAGKGFLTGEGGGLMGGMRDVGSRISGGFSQGLQGLGQMARPVANMNQSIGQGVAAAGQAVGQGFNQATQAVGGAVDATGRAIGDTANAVGGAVQQAGSGVWNDIMKGWNGGAAPAPTANAAPAAAASPTGGTQSATGPAIASPGQVPSGMQPNHVSSIPRAQPVSPWEDPRYFGDAFAR